MKKIVFTQNAPAAIGPYSQAVLSGNLLFVSGQIPMDPVTGDILSDHPIQTQARLVMDNLQAILKEAGSSWGEVLKATIYITDMNTFAAVNEVYASYFAENPPARECVAVAALPKGVDVEISLVAEVKE